MSDYHYVTPYWRDSQEVLGEGIKAYTGTTFFILNCSNVKASIKIQFYDLAGNLFADMDVQMFTPAHSVLDMRIVDIISFKNPTYRTTSNLRTGSMRIYSDVPLAISGKMFNGKSTSVDTQDLNVWSIPFFEVQLEKVKLEKIGDPIPDPVNDFGEYFKRKRPFR